MSGHNPSYFKDPRALVYSRLQARRPPLATRDTLVWGLTLRRTGPSLATTLTPVRNKRATSRSGRRGGRRGRRVRGGRGAGEGAGNLVEETIVGIELRHVPHHHTTKAGELLAIVDGGLELRAFSVTTTSTGAGRDTEVKLDIAVLAVARPVVPDVHVEGVLAGGAGNKVGNTAPVVVELNHDKVKGNLVECRAKCCIWVHALRSRREVELLTASAVHEAAELVAKGGQVVCCGFKVKVEAIHHSSAKGAVNTRPDGTKHVPNQLGGALCLARG